MPNPGATLETGKDIKKRWESAQAKRLTFESTWQEIADDVLGLRDFNTFRTPGEQRMRRIYDTTGLLAAQLLAGGLHGLLTNPATKWFYLRTDDDRQMEDPDVAFWVEDASEVTLRAFQRGSANFTPQMAEFYLDLVAFGTGCLYVTEGEEGASFSSRPLSEIYVSEDFRGQIDTVFRKFDLEARQFQQQFGTGASSKADRLVEQGKSGDPVCVLHVVHPRDDITAGNIDSSGMPWRSAYVLFEEEKIISEGGYHENPYIVARWAKESGEVFGRGPGFTALSDQRMLNEMGRTLIIAAQKAVDPPLLVSDDGVISQVRTVPGGLTVVRSGFNKEEPVRPLQTGARFDVSEAIIGQRQQAVRNAFSSQLLQLFEDPRMTATQVLELSNQAQRLLAPVLGRLQNELLEPLVDRVFGIELRRGAFLPPPQALLGQDLRVEYVSPVLRAQRTSDARSIMELWNAAGLMGQIDPTVLDNLSADESIRYVAEALGVPVKALRKREDVFQLRQAKAEMMEQENQMAALVEGAGAAKDLGQAAQAVMPQEPNAA